MKFKKLFTKSNRRKPRANTFVLESLEPRLLLSATPMIAAVVTTDHLDYAPGETAVITTSNQAGDGLQFEAGELVRFQVGRTDGMADAAGTTAGVGPTGNEAWYVTDGVGGFTAHQQFDANGQAIDRDANGVADWIAPDNDNTINSSISTSWFVEEQYRNSSLVVTAAGQESGAVANQAFTDAATNTSTTLTSSVASSTYGDAVVFTVIVSNNSGVGRPSGTVEFFDGTTLIGSDSAPGKETTTSSRFKLSTTRLTVGTHDIHAVFTGTVGVFNDSASGHITQTVSQKTIEGRFTADSKVYDGNVSATVLTRTLIAVEATDVVSLIGGTATFDTASVAGGKTVTLVGVSITGADAFNYTLLSSTITDTATINKAEATVGFTGTYDGAAHSAIATGVLGEILSGLSGPTVGSLLPTHTDVGTYLDDWRFVDVTGNYNNATGTVALGTAATTTITKADVTVNGGFNGVYDGAAHTATATATGVLGESLSGLVLNATPHTNVGNYNDGWTFTDITGNYNSTIGSVVSSITAKAISHTIGSASHDYGSTVDLAAALGGTFLTGVNGETLSLAYSSTGNNATANVGSYAITGNVSNGTGLASNYTVTLTDGTMTVGAKAISHTIGNTSHVYGGTVNLAATLGATFLTGVNGETLGLAYSSTGNSATANVGSYAITGNVSNGTGLASNYTVTLTNGTLTVGAQAISHTISNSSHLYGDTANLATDLGATFLTGVNGETLGLAYSSTGNSATANVGSYAITGSISDGTGLVSNYTVTLTDGTMTVGAKAISHTISNTSHVYGGTVNLAATLGATFLTGVNGETLGLAYSSTGNSATANVGSYAITGNVSNGTGLASNYTVTLTNGTLTVGAQAISHTISNSSHLYGDTANLATDLGATFLTGVNGETLGLAYSSTGNSATANVGSYAITGSISDGTGLVSNYTVTLTDGTMTVGAKAISHTISNTSHVYGGTVNLAATLGATFLTGVNGETLGLAYSSTGNSATANVGSYAITGSVSDGTGLVSNYTVAPTDGTLTVTKASVTLTGAGLNGSGYFGTYDGAAHAAAVTVTGVGGVIIGPVTSLTTHTNAGTYSDTVTYTDGTGNYLNASKVVKSYILKAAVTMTGAGLNGSGYFGTYDAAAHTAAVTVTGVGGVIIGPVTSLTTHTNAGTYSDTVTYTDGTGNYLNASKVVKSYILKAAVTMTGAGLNGSGYFGTYDAAAHTAAVTVTGVGGVIIGPVTSLTTHTNAGTYSDTVTYTDGTGNYLNASKVVKSYILKAAVTMTGAGLNGSGYFGTYDAAAHTATATVKGVGGVTVGTATSTTHTNAGTYSDTVTFAGDANYKAASKTVTSYILKASVTMTGAGLNGSGYFGTYDGTAHAATATVTGVGGVVLGPVTSSTTHTNVGIYSDTVTFAGDANYKVTSKVVKSYIL